jgi:hypothetical protein
MGIVKQKQVPGPELAQKIVSKSYNRSRNTTLDSCNSVPDGNGKATKESRWYANMNAVLFQHVPHRYLPLCV